MPHSNQITEYSPTEAALAELRAQYADKIYDVTTTAGMKDAKAARAVIRRHRTDLEATRKEIKAPVLDLSKRIDSEAKRITAELRAIEEPIDAQIKKEEQRKAAEKAERERIERDRITTIQGRIAAMTDLLVKAATATAAEAVEMRRWLDGETVDETYQEFQARAAATRADVLGKLQEIIASKRAAEEERNQLELERKNIERERAELERMNAEARAREAAEAQAEPAPAPAQNDAPSEEPQPEIIGSASDPVAILAALVDQLGRGNWTDEQGHRIDMNAHYIAAVEYLGAALSEEVA